MHAVRLALVSAAVLSGCSPPTFSCEGLDADQSADAMRTCVFAADITEDGFGVHGDAPATVALGGAPLSLEDRPTLAASRTADDGTPLAAVSGVAVWRLP